MEVKGRYKDMYYIVYDIPGACTAKEVELNLFVLINNISCFRIYPLINKKICLYLDHIESQFRTIYRIAEAN